MSDTIGHETFLYGADSETQFIRYHRSSSEKRTVFAIIHGGYWKKKYGVDTSGIDSLVPFLLSRGYDVCLIEYRRVGHAGGGWPGTNDDILQALYKLEDVICSHEVSAERSPECHAVDCKRRVVVLGHSAGGTLALWATSKMRKLTDAMSIALCVAVAPIGDLVEGHARKLSDDGDAISLYMGCDPSDHLDQNGISDCPYSLASPHKLLPLKVRTLIAIGTLDSDVPPDMVIEFHKLACDAHNLQMEIEIDGCTPTDDNPTNENTENTECVSGNKNVQFLHPATPALLVVADADHYNILNASSDKWLELFVNIEKHLIE